MYKYNINHINEESRWIFIKSDDENNLEDPDTFVCFVKKIQSHLKGNIVSVGDTQYRLSNDNYGFIYQWDNLFGIVVIYPENITSNAARTILNYYLADSRHKLHMILTDISELQTPVGLFYIDDGDSHIPFSVQNNIMNFPYEIRDENDIIIDAIETENNYDIIISAKHLEIGKDYAIQFSDGIWNYLDADEYSLCFNTVIDDWVVGIGAYDPNGSEKEDQEWEKHSKLGYLQQLPIEEYDESRFSTYTIEELNERNGFRFKIYDHELEYVSFSVSWLKKDHFTLDDCECALSCWLC